MLTIRRALECLFLSTLLLESCDPPVGSNPNDYVGEYVLTPHDTTVSGFADFVVLKRDHTAMLLRFDRDSDKVITSEGRWDLTRAEYDYLSIGKFSYSIERSNAHIWLGINTDLGQRYEKVR